MTPMQMHEVFKRVEQLAAQPSWQDRILVRKAGRFVGGDSAAVAELIFDNSDSGWLPITPHGGLDWPEACRRLKLAMEFIAALCE